MDELTKKLSKFENWAVEAKYLRQPIEAYRNNPFIEALPGIMSGPDVIEVLGYYPKYRPAQRFLPDHIRLHQIQTSLKFFHPLPEHLRLEAQFSCMIRQGYLGRNPISPQFFSNIRQRVNFIRQTQLLERVYNPTTTATGFGVLGLPGTGKSASIAAILAQYPQMISHTQYKMRAFYHEHLVWLVVQTPHDGTISGLCRNFFAAIDDLMGTSYLKKYGRHRIDTKNAMIADMANLALLYGIGVLVLDELQNLNSAKSGGADLMLQFFVQLINEIGIPLVFVGTDEARTFLTKALHKIRRLEGQGDVVWTRLEEGPVWTSFVKALWDYQFTKHVVQLTDDLQHVLYDESQGIIDFALKLYMLAQTEAILEEREVVTEQLIREVAKKRLRLAQPILAALRTKDERVLRKLDVKDVMTLDLEEYWKEARERLADKEGQGNTKLDAEPSAAQPPATQAKQPKLPRRSTEQPDTTSSTGVVSGDGVGTESSAGLAQAEYLADADEFLSPVDTQ